MFIDPYEEDNNIENYIEDFIDSREEGIFFDENYLDNGNTPWHFMLVGYEGVDGAPNPDPSFKRLAKIHVTKATVEEPEPEPEPEPETQLDPEVVEEFTV